MHFGSNRDPYQITLSSRVCGGNPTSELILNLSPRVRGGLLMQPSVLSVFPRQVAPPQRFPAQSSLFTFFLQLFSHLSSQQGYDARRQRVTRSGWVIRTFVPPWYHTLIIRFFFFFLRFHLVPWLDLKVRESNHRNAMDLSYGPDLLDALTIAWQLSDRGRVINLGLDMTNDISHFALWSTLIIRR